MGNEICTVGGAIATAGTAIANGATLGQCKAVNSAVCACASYTANKALETMVLNGAAAVGAAVHGTAVGVAGLVANDKDLLNAAGDIFVISGEAAKKVGTGVVDNVNGILNSTPGVGHIKGGIHDLCGDDEGARKAYFAANRMVGVIGGAVAGSIGGPAGAIAGGIAGGAAMDGVHTGYASLQDDKYSPQGQIAAWTQVLTAENGEDVVDGLVHGIVTPVFDGIVGYKIGKAVNALEGQSPQETIAGGGEKEGYVPQKRKLDYDSAKRRQLNDGTAYKAVDHPEHFPKSASATATVVQGSAGRFADNPNHPNNPYQDFDGPDSNETADTISSDSVKETWEYEAVKSVGKTYGLRSKVVKLPSGCNGRGMQLLIEDNNRSVTLIQHAGDKQYGLFIGSPEEQAYELLRTVGKNINENTETLNLLGCHVDKTFAQHVQSYLNADVRYHHITVQVLQDFPIGGVHGEWSFSINAQAGTFSIFHANAQFFVEDLISNLHKYLKRP